MLDGDRLLVGVEIGALSVSTDFGETFTELAVDPDPRERDIHRILVHPERPDRIIVANGIVGLMTSEDRGKTWRRNKMPDKANYPDAIVLSPDNPDLVFMTAGTGWPSNWYVAGRGRGKILRSRDGGATWTRLLGGLPDGQRAVFSALTIEASTAGDCALCRRHRRPGVREPERGRDLDGDRRRAAGVEGRVLPRAGARARQDGEHRRHRDQRRADAAGAGGRRGGEVRRGASEGLALLSAHSRESGNPGPKD